MSSPVTLTKVDNTGTTGEYEISWNETGKDAQFYAYRLYVREQGATEWILAWETTEDTASYSYDLFQFAANTTTELCVVEVTQSVSQGLVEGAYNVDSFTTSGLPGYYIINADDSSQNFYLEHATGHTGDDVWEEGVFTLIGRGRKLDRGTHLGDEGSITATLYQTPTRTVREQLLELRALRENAGSCDAPLFIRSPFGDIIKVAITGIPYTRVPGVGLNDMMDVTINYIEVA